MAIIKSCILHTCYTFPMNWPGDGKMLMLQQFKTQA